MEENSTPPQIKIMKKGTPQESYSNLSRLPLFLHHWENPDNQRPFPSTFHPHTIKLMVRFTQPSPPSSRSREWGVPSTVMTTFLTSTPAPPVFSETHLNQLSSLSSLLQSLPQQFPTADRNAQDSSNKSSPLVTYTLSSPTLTENTQIFSLPCLFS